MILRKIILAIGLVTICPLQSAQAQQGGEDYQFYYSIRKPDCVPLTVNALRKGNTISGNAWFGSGRPRSQMSGTMDNTNRFSISLAPVDEGGPQGTITGILQQQNIIQATVSGTGCNDGPINIHIGQ